MSALPAAGERRAGHGAAPAAPRDYLPALTGLRFFLAIWVLLNHITGGGMMLEAWSKTLPTAVTGLMRGGYLAVQTFFILSGFVLARTYAQTVWNRGSLRRFAVARFARIYPVYFVSLIVISPIIIEMLLQPVWTAGQRLYVLANYALVLQGWTTGLGVGWNTPAWTLSCEFFFYLCFPLLFTWLRHSRWPAIWLTFGLSIVFPILLDHGGVPWHWKPIYHLADFVAGIATARMFTLLEGSGRFKGRGFWLYVPALAAGVWLIVHPAMVEGSGADINTFLRPLNVMLLTGLALGGGLIARGLSSRIADFLGKASYSMYVLHVPILWWFGRYYVHGRLQPSRPMASAFYVGLVVLVSSIVFKWLEAPASAWIRAQEKKRTPPRPSAGY